VRAGRVATPAAPPLRALRLAAGVALALCAWGTRASHMTRPEQMAFIAALVLPTALVAVPGLASAARWSRPRGLGAALAIVALWAVAWLPIAWRSPWIASLVDGSAVLEMLARTRDPAYNLLVDTVRPGQSSLFLVFQGGGLLGWLDVVPTIPFVQGVHAAWLAVAAVLVATAAAQPGGGVDGAGRRGHPARRAARHGRDHVHGAASDRAHPAVRARARRRRHPSTAFAGGAGVRRAGDGAHGDAPQPDAARLGQLDPDLVRFQLNSAVSGRLDGLLGSLLVPFAAPRTGLRLWGDCLFDPLGAALAAVGIAYCLRERTVAAWALLGMLLLTTAPGGFSSYDRASLLRLPAAPVPLVLLAAVGLRVLAARCVPPRAERRVAMAAAIAILASGWIVMAVVNPRILPRSATGITIEAMRDADAGDAVVLLAKGWDPQASPLYLETLPPAPLRWTPYRTAADLDAVGAATLLFWSPGVEDRSGVAASVCARWPAARVYVLTDAAGLSRAFAATTGERAWTPALPAERWSATACPATLPTEGRIAADAIAAAHELTADGRPADATDTLRRAARRTVLAYTLYDELARRLLATATTPADLDEAAFWARRAATVTGYCVPGPVATLIEVYRRLGRDDDRRATAHAAEAAHAANCLILAVDHPFRR